MIKQIFVNLPVKNLKRTMDFYKCLGFDFNQKFSDQNAACMILGENIYAMLLVEKFFKTFTMKEVCTAKKNTGVLLSLSVANKDMVDDLVNKAVDSGGIEQTRTHQHGWMYGRSFEDLDGHIWEIFYMDESKLL